MKFFTRSLDNSSHYETKSWLERIVILGMSQNPSQIVVTDKGNYIVHFRDGFTGGGAHPMARGGAIFS
jgi:hypothetical protein